jgi:hypothetical protein
MKIIGLTVAVFLVSYCSCDYDTIQEYEIENNLSMTLFIKIESNGCGLSIGNGRGFPNLVNDSVKPQEIKVILRKSAGISTYPKKSDYTCIKELLLYTLNGNDTVKSNIDYSKNQNMEYYYRNKTTGVYLIKVDSTNYTFDW